jgi:hypothetical protein
MDILSSSQKTLITARGNFYIIYAAMTKTSDDPGGSVAAWLSEKVLRGRGPDASGFESHRRGRIFSKEGTSAGPWMCVCLLGADGRVVEGRINTLSATTARSVRVRVPSGRAYRTPTCILMKQVNAK